MPMIKPISFQTKHPLTQKLITLGSSTEIQKIAAKENLPQRLYEIYAPVIGNNKLVLGNVASRKAYLPKLRQILEIILTEQFPAQKMAVKEHVH